MLAEGKFLDRSSLKTQLIEFLVQSQEIHFARICKITVVPRLCLQPGDLASYIEAHYIASPLN